MISTRSVCSESVARVVATVAVILALTSACATAPRDQSLKPSDRKKYSRQYQLLRVMLRCGVVQLS